MSLIEVADALRRTSVLIETPEEAKHCYMKNNNIYLLKVVTLSVS